MSARPVRQLIEGLERVGIDPVPLLAEAGLVRSMFESEGHPLQWPTYTIFCDAVGAAVGHDVAKLREIGAAITRAPSFAFVGSLARTVISLRTLYQVAERWVAPTAFPHLRLFVRFGAKRRILLCASIPHRYRACETFLQITVGNATAFPVFLGAPPCRVLASEVTDRTIDLELELPEQRSLLGAGARLMTRFSRQAKQQELLETERIALSDGLAATQRTNNELRTVLENLPDMVVIHVGGRILFVNRAFSRALGYAKEEELVGRALVSSVDPRSHALFSARMAQPAGAPGVPELTEAWLRCRDGEPILVEVAPPSAVVFDGREARLVVGRDIADRDRLKQQLATADRLASLGLLAAGVAHEVNNPLGYVLNNIEMARRHLTAMGPDADPARHALQVALEGVDRIRFIVRELLLLARAEPVPISATDLPSAIESTLALARMEIVRSAKLTMELEPVAPVCGSVPRIAQIVLNLVLNALEAMRAGDPSENELVVRVRGAGDAHVLMEIADNGPGVATRDVGRIFDPFFTTKSEGRGTGLGLAITQRLVAESGGEISFSSEPGRGTTFRVLFKVYAEPGGDHLPQAGRLAPGPTWG